MIYDGEPREHSHGAAAHTHPNDYPGHRHPGDTSFAEPRPKRLELTTLGMFANRHSVLTPITYWRNVWSEVTAMADDGVDFHVLLDERARGYQYLHDHWDEFQAAVERDNDAAGQLKSWSTRILDLDGTPIS